MNGLYLSPSQSQRHDFLIVQKNGIFYSKLSCRNRQMNNRKQMARSRGDSSRSTYLLKGLIIKCGQVSGKPRRTVRGPRAGSSKAISTPSSKARGERLPEFGRRKNLENRPPWEQQWPFVLGHSFGTTAPRKGTRKINSLTSLSLPLFSCQSPPAGQRAQGLTAVIHTGWPRAESMAQKSRKGTQKSKSLQDESTRQTCIDVVGHLLLYRLW